MENLYVYFLLFSAIHGFILAVILFFKKKSLQNILLSFLLVIFSCYLSELFFSYKGILTKYPSFWLLTFPSNFFIGPILLLFHDKLFSFKISKYYGSILIGIPVIIYLSFIPYYVLDDNMKINLTCPDNTLNHIAHVKFLLQRTTFIIYTLLFLTYILFKRKHSISNYKKRNNWFFIFLYCFVFLLISEFVLLISTHTYHSLLFTLFLAIIIHLFTYAVIINPNLFFKLETSKLKYQNSSINDIKSTEISKNFINYLTEEKPYLDDSFNLEKAASYLTIPKHQLSQVISQNLQSSFSKIVKKFRVEESITLLKNDISKKRKIIDIAFACGFKDTSSFHRAFKELQGTTPSNYRDSFSK